MRVVVEPGGLESEEQREKEDMATETIDHAAEIERLEAELQSLPEALRDALNAGDFDAYQRVEFRQKRIPIELHGLRVKQLEAKLTEYRSELARIDKEREALIPEWRRLEDAERTVKAELQAIRRKMEGLDGMGYRSIITSLEKELEQLKGGAGAGS